MNYKNLILLLILHLVKHSYSQDTIKIGKSYHYSSEDVKKLSGKGFGGKYGQENIKFSDKFYKVDYCYYNESVRTCYGLYYKIENDTTLIIGDSLKDIFAEVWTFKKLVDNNYYVYRIEDGFIESGVVDTLIPLRQIKPFVTTTLDKKDTLWQTNDFTRLNRRYNYYTADFNISALPPGKIYEYYEVDTPPFKLNGDSLPPVEIERIQPCICVPMLFISSVTCIITSDGKIINIEQALGDIPDNCAYTMMDVNKMIFSWGKVKPALRNGVPVNIRWFIKINDLSSPKIHPAYADTDKNRKAYLKSRKYLNK